MMTVLNSITAANAIRYSATDINIRLAILPDEAEQLHKLINYAFRGKPIQHGSDQSSTIIFPQLHMPLFHNLTERIKLDEIHSTQQTNNNAVLVAVIPHNSKYYNNDTNNITVHDGVLVACVRIEQLLLSHNHIKSSINDKQAKYRTAHGNSFELSWYSVDPSYSGHGIGSMIFHYGEQYGIQQMNCTQSLLFMFDCRNELNTLYTHKYGYCDITDERSEFIPPTKSDVINPDQSIYWLVLQRTFPTSIQYTMQYDDNTTFIMRKAKFTDAAQLSTVCNWSYRGKAGVEQWTTESQYISSPRITASGVHELIQQSLLQINDIALFVAVKQYNTPVSDDMLNDRSMCFISPTEQLVGCIKLERVTSHPCDTCMKINNNKCTHVCEVGLYAVDPSETGKQYGKHLLSQAELYAINTLHCTTSILYVLSCRAEFTPMYTKNGYIDTLERTKFDIPTQHVKPEWQNKLEFATFKKLLVQP